MIKRTNSAVWNDNRKHWRIDIQQNGVRKSFYSSIPGRNGQREANAKADAWLAEGKNVVSRGKVTMLEAIEEWKEYLKVRTSKSNWEPAISRVDKWVVPVIGHILASGLTEQHCQNVIDKAYKKGNLSKKSLQNIRGDITSILKFCRKSSYTTLRTEDIDIPNRAKQSERAILSKDSVKKVFLCDKTLYKGKEVTDDYIYAYRLMLSTGLRPGELLALHKSHAKDGYIKIDQSYNKYKELTSGKNENAQRKIKLSDQALKAVEGQINLLKKNGVISQILFPSPSGGYISEETFRRHWYRFCKHNGIEKIQLYEIRHTFVSVNKEMPEGLKKMVVGHSEDMDTEGVYSHEFDGDQELAAEYITNAFDRILKS